MLRFRYMPSDYHPLILILGSGDDLRKLATLLRSFAKDEAEVRLESLDFCAPGKTKLLLTTRHDRHARSLLQQRFGDCPANSARTADYYSPFIVPVSHQTPMLF